MLANSSTAVAEQKGSNIQQRLWTGSLCLLVSLGAVLFVYFRPRVHEAAATLSPAPYVSIRSVSRRKQQLSTEGPSNAVTTSQEHSWATVRTYARALVPNMLHGPLCFLEDALFQDEIRSQPVLHGLSQNSGTLATAACTPSIHSDTAANTATGVSPRSQIAGFCLVHVVFLVSCTLFLHNLYISTVGQSSTQAEESTAKKGSGSKAEVGSVNDRGAHDRLQRDNMFLQTALRCISPEASPGTPAPAPAPWQSWQSSDSDGESRAAMMMVPGLVAEQTRSARASSASLRPPPVKRRANWLLPLGSTYNAERPIPRATPGIHVSGVDRPAALQTAGSGTCDVFLPVDIQLSAVACSMTMAPGLSQDRHQIGPRRDSSSPEPGWDHPTLWTPIPKRFGEPGHETGRWLFAPAEQAAVPAATQAGVQRMLDLLTCVQRFEDKAFQGVERSVKWRPVPLPRLAPAALDGTVQCNGSEKLWFQPLDVTEEMRAAAARLTSMQSVATLPLDEELEGEMGGDLSGVALAAASLTGSPSRPTAIRPEAPTGRAQAALPVASSNAKEPVAGMLDALSAPRAKMPRSQVPAAGLPLHGVDTGPSGNDSRLVDKQAGLEVGADKQANPATAWQPGPAWAAVGALPMDTAQFTPLSSSKRMGNAASSFMPLEVSEAQRAGEEEMEEVEQGGVDSVFGDGLVEEEIPDFGFPDLAGFPFSGGFGVAEEEAEGAAEGEESWEHGIQQQRQQQWPGLQSDKQGGVGTLGMDRSPWQLERSSALVGAGCSGKCTALQRAGQIALKLPLCASSLCGNGKGGTPSCVRLSSEPRMLQLPAQSRLQWQWDGAAWDQWRNLETSGGRQGAAQAPALVNTSVCVHEREDDSGTQGSEERELSIAKHT